MMMTNGRRRTAIVLRPKEAAMGMELGAPTHKPKTYIAPPKEATAPCHPMLMAADGERKVLRRSLFARRRLGRTGRRATTKAESLTGF